VLTAPGIGNRVFANLEINGTVIESFGCEISDTQTGCTDSVDTMPIPAGSWMEMSLNQLTETPVFPVEAVMTGFQLSK
jgi:hypothetical protein